MEIDHTSFGAEVLEHGQPVLVDFWASWCPPCKMMDPIIDKLQAEYDGRARVAKVNIDRNPGLAAEYGIQGVPTFIVFSDGEVHGRLTAAQTQKKLRCLLDEWNRTQALEKVRGLRW